MLLRLGLQEIVGDVQLAAKKPARKVVSSGAPLRGGRYVIERPRDLQNPRLRHETYRKMGQTDPFIWEALLAHLLPLMRADWSVRPGLEPDDPESLSPEEKRSADIAEFVASNILGEEGATYGREFWARHSWTELLQNVILILRHGFALFYKERVVVQGKIVFRRLTYLEPETIQEWQFGPDGSLLAVVRNYHAEDGSNRDLEVLPVEDLALFVAFLEGTRLEGTPLVRPMFGAWTRAEFINRLKMIAAQRAAVGIPVVKRDASEDGGDSGDVQKQIDQFLTQIVSGDAIESSFLNMPNQAAVFEWVQQDGSQLSAFDDLTQPEKQAIAHAGGTRAQMQGGEGQTGARASAETQQKLQFVLSEAIGQIIAEQMTRGVAGIKGPVAELVDLNFANSGPYPWIQASGIDPNEATREIPSICAAKNAGLLPSHPSLQKEIARRLRLKLPAEAFEVPEIIPVPGSSVPPPVASGKGLPISPSMGSPKPGQKADESKKGAKQEHDRRSVQLALYVSDVLRLPAYGDSRAREKGMGRAPTLFEDRVLAIGQISAAMTTGTDRFVAALRTAWHSMIQDVIARGRSGKIDRDTLGGFRRSKPKGEDGFKRRLREAFVSVAAQGQQHAVDELGRQVGLGAKEGASLSALLLEAVPPGGKPPKGVRPGSWSERDLAGDIADEARVTADISIDSVWQRLVDETIKEATRQERSGKSGAELWDAVEHHLQGLSETPLEQIGRQDSTVAYNQGRDYAAKVAATNGDADWAMRSEVLDSNTCESCGFMDGAIALIGSPEYEAMMPPAGCEGGDRCRGVIVILGRSVTDAMSEEP